MPDFDGAAVASPAPAANGRLARGKCREERAATGPVALLGAGVHRGRVRGLLARRRQRTQIAGPPGEQNTGTRAAWALSAAQSVALPVALDRRIPLAVVRGILQPI